MARSFRLVILIKYNILSDESSIPFNCASNGYNNKEERYSRVPRLSEEMEICKQQSEIEIHLPAISIYGYVGGRQFLALWALEWAWQIYISVKILYLA